MEAGRIDGRPLLADMKHNKSCVFKMSREALRKCNLNAKFAEIFVCNAVRETGL